MDMMRDRESPTEVEIAAPDQPARPPGRLLGSPPVAGGLVALAGITLWFLLESWANQLGAASDSFLIDGVFVVLLTLQAGYFYAVMPRLRRAGRQCIHDLHPVMTGSDLGELEERFSRSGLHNLKWSLPIGTLLAVVLQEAQMQRISGFLAEPSPALGEFVTVLAACSGWSLGLAAVTVMLGDAAAIRRLGRESVKVDLLRTVQLAPFSQYGLKLSGAVAGLMAMWAISLVLVDAFLAVTWGKQSAYLGIALIALYVCLSVAAYLFPQLGVREAILREKEEVCGELSAMLPPPEQAVETSVREPERFAALLGSLGHIQSIPDWPSGHSNRLRFLVYLAVPLLAWSAAALVEEVISRLIG